MNNLAYYEYINDIRKKITDKIDKIKKENYNYNR